MQLLRRGQDYFHPALREEIGNTEVIYSDSLGKVVHRKDPTGDLGARSSFTLDDLWEYYKKKMFGYFRIKLQGMEEKRALGALKWLVESYPLDEVLFAIDAMMDLRSSRDQAPPRGPLDAQDYLYDGRERLARIQGYLADAGIGPARL